jgi:hypothetical protein
VEEIGGTETCNCEWLQQIGDAELVRVGFTEIKNSDQSNDFGESEWIWIGHAETHLKVLEFSPFRSVTPSAPHPEGPKMTCSNFVI